MAPRMVAYVTPLYFDEKSCLGGGERYPLNLARGVVAASKGRFAVDLFSFGAENRRLSLAPGVGLRVLKAEAQPQNALDVLSWELPDALRAVDLVHIHQAYTRCGEAALLAAKLLGKPICATDHGAHTSTLGSELGHLELADHIITYSQFAARIYGAVNTPISVIQGGVDGSLFRPPVSKSKRDYLLYVGRLLPHKGIDVLIDALPPGVPLKICGRAYHRDYWRVLNQRARRKDVTFLTEANDDDLVPLYANAFANVLPSVYRDMYGQVHIAPELMGLTLLEAMSCGTPAICSRVGGMPEFVEHGATGFVFDTPNELRAYIERLAADSALCDAMGRNARNVIETRFDLTPVGARVVDIYDRLISRAAQLESAA